MTYAVRGYASLFNKRDKGRDIVKPGAFRDSLLRRPAGQVCFLWQHSQRDPIGVVTALREDSRGLYFEADILTETLQGPGAAALVERKGIAVSIGYRTVDAENLVQDGEPVRVLKKVELHEVSLVSMPMLDGTEVWRAPAAPAPTGGTKSDHVSLEYLVATNRLLQAQAAALTTLAVLKRRGSAH